VTMGGDFFMSEDLEALKSFDGKARLFPLPNLVFFPQALQPLHIFEPRYRVMTADALASDGLITLTMLKEGWDTGYHIKPDVEEVATIGRIVANQLLEDGRYNLLLRGLSRVRITREVYNDKPYRDAEVEILADKVPEDHGQEEAMLSQLIEQIPIWFPAQDLVAKQFKKLLDKNLSLSALCDIFCFALPLESHFKQAMLEQLDVVERTRALLDRMARRFPPDFSSN
jgi:Lon protease-like protein